MSFVNDIYELYRDQLCDDEDDVITIVLNLLEDQSRENMVQLIQNMGDEEVNQMMGIYLVEMLKMKMVQDGKISPYKPAPVIPTRIH
ncbi:hypothetical protein J2Z48_000679 [Croceifilum oryzae]|uniref:Cytosolic protein n=1 Tax=Croceifilum oryzae TaxID=1553429 RepID=A0AAJ1TGB9_9BACL|nr:DUF6154 family protein [Croceifilum oryzae]MDQ0416512.1 hypothetical protein [Croceifilum oryzae]